MKRIIKLLLLIFLLPLFFQTGAPAMCEEVLFAPNLIAPADKSAWVLPPPNFIWSPVLGADNYHIQITTDVTFLNINPATDVDIAGHLDTLYAPPAGFLDADTMYFWRVKAASFSGIESDWSYIQMFLTGVNGIDQHMATDAITVAPHPIERSAAISFDSSMLSLLSAGELRVFVFSASGRLVDNIIYEHFYGDKPLEFYADKYIAGVYHLVFVANNKMLGAKKVLTIKN